jgi:hypothetical protein
MKKPDLVMAAPVFLAAFLSGCATSPQTAQVPDLLQQALAREATLSGSYAVAAEDGFFSAQIASSAPPEVTAHEGVHQVTVPIAKDIPPAECFVYHDVLDTAATLSELIEQPLSNMPRTEILKIDAGTFGHLPFLYQERLFLTEQKAAGLLKGIVVPFDSSLLACLHDTAGYSEAFRQMAASFAETMVLRDALQETAVHEEVLLWRLRDMNIGYTVNRAGPDAAGDIKSTVETALLLPRSATETLARDEYNVVFEQTDGDLISGHYAETENGEIKLLIKLDREEQGGYRVEGTFQGKEIDAPLQATSGVVGPWYQHREMIRAANPATGQPRALSVDSYVPSANPLQTVRFELTPTGARLDGLPEYQLAFSGVKATGVVDDKGQKSMTVKMGPLELQLSRAYSNGQP